LAPVVNRELVVGPVIIVRINLKPIVAGEKAESEFPERK
jgi:hypothetical protein